MKKRATIILAGGGMVNDARRGLAVHSDGAVDLSVKNNSTRNVTADSQANNLLINSGGKIIFPKDANFFKTPDIANISGRGELHSRFVISENFGKEFLTTADIDTHLKKVLSKIKWL
ncbi:MAG: hypothetical protein LBD30_00395 [Verrucomicrobiales bacterium]|nr:hypothetical protein [Verrucomicrobiales bacterium]